MLERVIIKNFRTIRKLEWKPQKLNVLVGPNNSGKTNLCYALRFLSAAMRHNALDDAAREACGAPNHVACRFAQSVPVQFEIVAHASVGREQPYRLKYGLALNVEAVPPHGATVLGVRHERLERLDKPDWPPLVERDAETVRVISEHDYESLRGRPPEEFRQELADSVVEAETTLPGSMLPGIAINLGEPSPSALVRFLRNIHYFIMDASHLRRQAPITDTPFLTTHGENLSSVLYTLSNEHHETYQELLELVREIEPRLDNFEFIPHADDTVIAEVVFKHISGNMTLSAMSDGTLLYLALCIIALQPRVKMPREFDRPSLVMIEEPENGLYARNFGKLVERLEELSEHTQVIITTHNPFLLDYFDDRPESIFVLDMPDEETGTTIRSPDPKAVDQLLEHMSMGEMLFREVLACE